MTDPGRDRRGREFALPWGGPAMVLLLLGGLAWVAQDRPVHPAVKSSRGTFGRHPSTPEVVAFAPARRVVATVFRDGSLEIIDRSGKRQIPRVIGAGAAEKVLAIAFSPDSRTLASGGEGPALKLWDLATDALRSSIPVRGPIVRKLAFSPDGGTLASGSVDGDVALLDVETGREIGRIAGRSGEIRGLAFSPDGKTLAVGASPGEVRLWDVAGGRERDSIRYPGRTLDGMSLSPDGKRLALALGVPGRDREDEVVIWTPGGSRVLCRSSDARVALSPDGRTLAVTRGPVVKLWEVESGREFATLEGHEGVIHSIGFSPDGRLLATAGRDGLTGLFAIDAEWSWPARP